jgi:hypothetical protein
LTVLLLFELDIESYNKYSSILEFFPSHTIFQVMPILWIKSKCLPRDKAGQGC